MFTLRDARSFARSKDLPDSAIARPSNRLKSHFFGPRGDIEQPGHFLIHSHELEVEERALLLRYAKPVYMLETRRKDDWRLLIRRNPYEAYPSEPTSVDGHFVNCQVELFHFHHGFDWLLPAALLDIRPTDISRERAADLFCEKVALDNHARLRFRADIRQ